LFFEKNIYLHYWRGGEAAIEGGDVDSEEKKEGGTTRQIEPLH